MESSPTPSPCSRMWPRPGTSAPWPATTLATSTARSMTWRRPCGWSRRDFAAFRTLADIATAREDWKGAYAAWQKVMELDPKTPGGEERLRVLKRNAVGEDT